MIAQIYRNPDSVSQCPYSQYFVQIAPEPVFIRVMFYGSLVQRDSQAVCETPDQI